MCTYPYADTHMYTQFLNNLEIFKVKSPSSGEMFLIAKEDNFFVVFHGSCLYTCAIPFLLLVQLACAKHLLTTRQHAGWQRVTDEDITAREVL